MWLIQSIDRVTECLEIIPIITTQSADMQRIFEHSKTVKIVACIILAIFLSFACIKFTKISTFTLEELNSASFDSNSLQDNFLPSTYQGWTEKVYAVGELLPIRKYNRAILSHYQIREPTENSGSFSKAMIRAKDSRAQVDHRLLDGRLELARPDSSCNRYDACQKNSAKIRLMLEEIERVKVLEQDKYALLYHKIRALQSQFSHRHSDGPVASSSVNDSAVNQNSFSQRKSNNGRHQNHSSQLYFPRMSQNHVTENPLSRVSHAKKTDLSMGPTSENHVEVSQVASISDDFNPEALFSGYNLAGGDTPGKNLDEKREEYILRALHKHHATAVISSRGDIILARKRASNERLQELQKRLSAQSALTGTKSKHDAPAGAGQMVPGYGQNVLNPDTKDGVSDPRSTSRFSPDDGEEQPQQALAKRSRASKSRAEIGFLAALKASRANPYKAAMTGAVFQHFIKLRRAAELKRQAN